LLIEPRKENGNKDAGKLQHSCVWSVPRGASHNALIFGARLAVAFVFMLHHAACSSNALFECQSECQSECWSECQSECKSICVLQYESMYVCMYVECFTSACVSVCV